MDPFALLGLAHDADEAAIKRAYAQRLRKTRPDDDPEGFQRLNEAYRAALARSKAGHAAPARGTWNRPVPVLVTAGPTGSQPASTPAPVDAGASRPVHESRLRVVPLDPQLDAPRSQPPTFDPAAFIAEFREYCAQDNPYALSRWLNRHPAFWNLPTKHAAGRMLLRALFEKPEHISEGCFAATSDFFHFDDALAGIDPLLLRRVRERGASAWLMREGNHGELARRIYGAKTPGGVHWVRVAIKRATGPFRWWRDLPNALRPGKSRRQVARVLLYLCDGNLADLPAPLDKEHARFWIEAASPGLGRSKLLVYIARSVAALVLGPLLLAITGTIPAYIADAPNLLGFATSFAWGVFVTVAAVLACIWSWIGVAWLNRKLDAASDISRGLRVTLVSITPALCVTALLTARLVDPILGVLFALVALLITFLRSRARPRRQPATARERLSAYIGLVLVCVMLSGPMSAVAKTIAATGLAKLAPTVAVVVLALGFWAWDWHKRGFLKPRV